jgi:hypothetical protein
MRLPSNIRKEVEYEKLRVNRPAGEFPLILFILPQTRMAL